MHRDKKLLYAFSISLFVLLFFGLFIPYNNSRVVAAAILLPAAVAIFFLLKKRSVLSIHKQTVLLLVSVFALLYITLYFVTGIFFGFHRSLYVLSISSVFKRILPITLIVLCSECIRRVFLSQQNTIADIFSYLACLLADIYINGSVWSIYNFAYFMDVMGMTLFPAVTANLLYHYLSKRYGAYPNIVYRLVFSLYAYLIPFLPATPDALVAFVKLILPLFVYLFIDGLYEKKPRIARKRNTKATYIGAGALIVAMSMVIMLISCQFTYGAIVIGSGSMTGELNVGDVTIYRQYDGQIIKEGEILVFEKDNMTVIHRVVEIKRVNGINRYYTKGDANEERDVGYITESNIVGITNFKISYIGYPTIWIRKIFS